jgi:crotonobetainyl-CoA:carnitine CoA-transferase CaiB-like acyl-CoA transferase
MWMLSSDLLTALNGADVPRSSGRGGLVNPLVGTYRTKEGRHVQLMFLQGDRYWPGFCRVIGRQDLADDVRFGDMASRRSHAKALMSELDSVFAQRTLEEWKALLSTFDAPWAPMQSVEELADDPQVLANAYVGEVVIDDGHSYRLPTGPVQFDCALLELRRAPEHGEHTEAVLEELGYDWDRICGLAECGVIP